ncbi:MAG: class A beta-lactamase-related serine hydrolase [Candidatus Pacebacteria bacterium]|nr:class A beta-lactamase-related serine hydrolase [Candidatus Paceibacterota bacterium]
MLSEDTTRSQEIKTLLFENGFSNTELGLAIIDLKEKESKIFGYNMDHFMYPASVYKIFVGAEVLRRVEIGDFSLDQTIAVTSPNDVDRDPKLFPGRSRKLLTVGEEITIEYLLDLMLSESDNTASNMLIDLVGRESINENIIDRYDWKGSGVTRKFLDRSKEDTKYRWSETTMTCARHVAEFFYLVESEKLISPFVSKKLKEYMMRWNRQGNRPLSLSEYTLGYHKGGYLENNYYAPFYRSYYKKAGFAIDYAAKDFFKLAKTILTKGWAFIRWVNDAGVVEGDHSHYVIAFFSVSKQLSPRKRFPTEKLAKVVYDYMEEKNK